MGTQYSFLVQMTVYRNNYHGRNKLLPNMNTDGNCNMVDEYKSSLLSTFFCMDSRPQSPRACGTQNQQTEQCELHSSSFVLYNTKERHSKIVKYNSINIINIIPEPTARRAVPGVSPGRGLLIPHGYLNPGKSEHSEV